MLRAARGGYISLLRAARRDAAGRRQELGVADFEASKRRAFPLRHNTNGLL